VPPDYALTSWHIAPRQQKMNKIADERSTNAGGSEPSPPDSTKRDYVFRGTVDVTPSGTRAEGLDDPARTALKALAAGRLPTLGDLVHCSAAGWPAEAAT
jgi:hypothetical protein